MRRILAGALIALCMAANARAHAECLAAPPAPPSANANADADALAQHQPEWALGDTRMDRMGRVVAPVTVNGHGPYRFIVDTGANRSVISSDLAQELGLTMNGVGDVHSIEGVTQAPLTSIDNISYARLPLSTGRIPVLQRDAVLAGEAGILGVDGMAGRRLRLDFRHRCIEIIPSRSAPRLRGWVTVQGVLRFNRLVTLRARIRGVAVNLLLDTGSSGSFANNALRAALGPVQASRDSIATGRAFTAGRPIVLDQIMVIPQILIGADLAINHVTAFVGDYHIFTLWGMQDEPTLLVGMDVLSQAREVAIDYDHATISFRMLRALPMERRGL
ncbi:MAG: aspartyl protease family protein [Pseudomonadota bacterium]